MAGPRTLARSVAAVAALSLVGSGCGDDDDQGSSEPAGADTTTTEAGAGDELAILVTDDDGVGAEGLDTLVAALTGIDAVELTVVAPAAQQSGTGGQVTDGPLTTAPARTAGGHEATSVDGFPADTIRVALDDMGLEPDLVISGINEGQNVGPLIDVSGTVGAARAAAREGIPALAVSQGLGQDLDYDQAADLVIDWLDDNREAIAAGELTTDHVVNLNVPSCDAGQLRGTVDVPPATSLDGLTQTSDCTSTAQGFTDDISAFANGFATISEIGVEQESG